MVARLWCVGIVLSAWLVACCPAVTPGPQIAPAAPVACASGSCSLPSNLRAVVRVVDGDTIEIESLDPELGVVGVRLIGIDTPERGQPGWAEARDFLRKLVEGKAVRLVREVGHANLDRYGRLLRLVYVDDLLVQVLIIRAGHSVYTDRWGRCPTIETAIRR